MKKKSIIYSDLSKKQLETLKEFVLEIISHQINDTIGKEEEMEAWREMSDFFGEQFEIIILEIQTKYIDDKNVIETEIDSQKERLDLLEINNLNKDKNRILKVYGEKGKICYDGYNNKNNYVFIDKKIVPTKLNLSPLQTIIKNLYKNIKENKFYSDLEYSYKIQKILLKLQKQINFK